MEHMQEFTAGLFGIVGNFYSPLAGQTVLFIPVFSAFREPVSAGCPEFFARAAYHGGNGFFRQNGLDKKGACIIKTV